MHKPPLNDRVIGLLAARQRRADSKNLPEQRSEEEYYDMAMTALNAMSNYELLEILADLAERERT